MGPVAELELGGPQELGVGLGHEEAGPAEGFLLGLLADQGREALGFGFLVGGEDQVWPGGLRAGEGVIFKDFQSPVLGYAFPTHFRDAYPGGTRPQHFS